MAQRKMYRTHRSEYVGCEVKSEALLVYVQQQALQGPAGWVNQGPRQVVHVPLSTLIRSDVTDALDRLVRKELSRVWDPTAGVEPLF